MQKKNIMASLRLAVIAGNVLYILWILYNAIDSGFIGRPLEIVVLTGLIFLLSFNIYFLKHKA